MPREIGLCRCSLATLAHSVLDSVQSQAGSRFKIVVGKADALHAEAATDLRCASEASKARELTCLHRFAWKHPLHPVMRPEMSAFARRFKIGKV